MTKQQLRNQRLQQKANVRKQKKKLQLINPNIDPFPAPLRFRSNNLTRINTFQGRNPYYSKPNRRLNRGKLPTVLAPLTQSNILSTYVRSGSDSVDFCIACPPTTYDDCNGTFAITPLIYGGRLGNQAITYTKFSVLRALLHYVPLRGTSEVGNIFIGGYRDCNPLDNDSTTNSTFLAQSEAVISPVWIPIQYSMPYITPKECNVLPNLLTDIPFTFYVAMSGVNHAVNYYGTFYLECSLKFTTNMANQEFDTTMNSGIFVLSAAGLNVPTAGLVRKTLVMIVDYSTVPNVDLGELVRIAPVDALNTPEAVIITHNGQNINYAVANDQGTISGMTLIIN